MSQKRVDQLKSGFDQTKELNDKELQLLEKVNFTCDLEDLADCNCYIITVPTPVDENNTPDLTALLSASKMVGSLLSDGDIVIYESTVYPGATEEDCAPIPSEQSGQPMPKLQKHKTIKFSILVIALSVLTLVIRNIGYLTLSKSASGSSDDIADLIDDLYRSIVIAGTHKAPSIKVAEAAKVIENTQRDVNIALINELAIIFDKLNIDTEDVLNAAKSKWNFLPFTPGLVGGHCIGVDPYYLTHKAIETGYNPEIILAGRRLNDSMSSHIANRIIKLMLNHKINVLDANVLVMGATFKENCPDVRNSKVFDLVTSLEEYSCNIDIYDPWIDEDDLPSAAKFNLISEPQQGYYDVIVIAVAHQIFIDMQPELIQKYAKEHHILF